MGEMSHDPRMWPGERAGQMSHQSPHRDKLGCHKDALVRPHCTLAAVFDTESVIILVESCTVAPHICAVGYNQDRAWMPFS
jgi:hypothetical protein